MARILIVEDEALIAADMEECLRARGHEIVGVADCAEQALAMTRTETPDLAVLDIRIRGNVDGIALSERLDVPCLFLTAHADTTTLQRALKNAPYGYLIKPFRDEELEAGVGTALARIQRDTQAREVERLLATTLGSLGEGVIACDAKLRVTYVNSVACELTGWQDVEAVGLPLSEVFALESETGVPVHPAGLAVQALEQRRTVRLDDGLFLKRRPNGFGLPVAGCVAPLRVGDGELAGAVVVVRDRSPEAAAVRDKLELQGRLLQAQRLEGLGLLAGGMAHRFNNLLAAMMANIELSKANAEQAIQPWLDEALGLGQRGAALCRQVLAYSGRAPASAELLDVNRFLLDAVELLTALVPKNVRLSVELCEEAANVRIDLAQLQQVLTNLVANAADALGQEHGSVVLRTRVKALTPRQLAQLGRSHTQIGGEFLALEVADTGAGMAPEVLRSAFEPFFSTRPGGSGLGLAAVDGIVRAHAGCIDAFSEPGAGTTICVYLPIPLIEARLTPSKRAALESETRPSMLLVGASPSVRSTLTLIASDLGFAVEAVDDLAAARHALTTRRGGVSVVLVDTHGGTSLERHGLEELHSVAPEARLGVLSGYQEGFARDHFEPSGARFYIRKPFSRDTVREKLSTLLSPVSTSGG